MSVIAVGEEQPSRPRQRQRRWRCRKKQSNRKA